VDEPVEAMVAPCECAGSMKWVHPACLNQWRRHNIAQSMFCSVCNRCAQHPQAQRVPACTILRTSHLRRRSVCNSRYRGAVQPSNLDFLRYELQLVSNPDHWRAQFALLYHHVLVGRCQRHVVCMLLRATLALLVLLLCAVVGRLVAAFASELIHQVPEAHGLGFRGLCCTPGA
jgi:hypothetical protein